MKLPEIKFPTFKITIPSTKKKVTFRPFLSLEEKILLTGQQSDDDTDIVDAIDQVITNCLIDDYDLDTLTTFDFDYVFLKLRAASVNNLIKIKYFDDDDKQEYDLEVDLNKVEVTIPENIPNKIKVDDITIELQFPNRKQMREVMEFTETLRAENEDVPQTEIANALVRKCVARIYDADDVYTDYTEDELQMFLDKLPINANKDLSAFIDSIPEISHTITYQNSLGNTKEVVLRGINDFFILR